VLLILEEHKQHGAEDQALEKKVEGKTAGAKKRATKRSEQLSFVVRPCNSFLKYFFSRPEETIVTGRRRRRYVSLMALGCTL